MVILNDLPGDSEAQAEPHVASCEKRFRRTLDDLRRKTAPVILNFDGHALAAIGFCGDMRPDTHFRIRKVTLQRIDQDFR